MGAGYAPIPSWQPIIISGTSTKISHVDDITRIVVMFAVPPPVLIQIPLYPLERYSERKRQFVPSLDTGFKNLEDGPPQIRPGRFGVRTLLATAYVRRVCG